jgi:transmembrane sensor
MAVPDDRRSPRADRPATAAAGPATSARALEDALAPFEEGLRQKLRTADDILRDAARRRAAARQARGGAGLLSVAALCATLWWLDPAYRSETLATAVGERRSWTLADGSSVTLNTDSRATASLHLRSRRVHLEQGEALFTVAHAPLRVLERSFTVQAPHTTIHDIGTVFAVRGFADGADVSVKQGRVRVDTEDGSSRELGAGESTSARQGRFSEPGPGHAHASAWAWSDGRLVVDGMPLRDVVRQIQRYRSAPIVLQDGPVGELRMSGQFELERLDELVDLLPSLAPVQVLRRADGSTHIEARATRR